MKTHPIKETIQMIHRVNPHCIPYTIIVAMIQAIIPIISLLFSAELLDVLFERQNPKQAFFLVGAMLSSITLLKWVSAVFTRKNEVMREAIVYEAEEEILMHTMHLRFEDMERAEVLNLLQQAREGQNSSGGLDTFLSFLESLITSVFLMIQAMIILWSLLWESSILFGLVLVMVVLYFVCNVYLVRKKNQYMSLIFEKNVVVNRVMQYYSDVASKDYHKGKEIRLYQLQSLIKEKIDEGVRYTSGIFRQYFDRIGKVEGFQQLFTILYNGLFYLFLLVKRFEKEISDGALLRYGGAVVQLSQGMSGCLKAMLSLQLRAIYFMGYAKFLELETIANTVDEPIVFESLECKHVSYTYPNGKTVLNDVSFTIKRHEQIALVGMNGAGKTTLVKLLLRLYEPTAGMIYINNKPVTSYTHAQCWQLYASVFQDFQLFPLSVKENICGENEFHQNRFDDVLKESGVFQKVQSMQAKENSVLSLESQDGEEVSGGEAQKLAIARALYANRDILILDEPTAALDPKAECEIYASFTKMVKDKTCIYISHRMSSTQFANRIYVLDQGKIVQCGSHQQLLNQTGLYQTLWMTQAKYYQV